jgi:hypothetical protein
MPHEIREVCGSDWDAGTGGKFTELGNSVLAIEQRQHGAKFLRDQQLPARQRKLIAEMELPAAPPFQPLDLDLTKSG